MIHKHLFLHTLSGRGIYEALVHTLYNQVEDFPDEYAAYSKAIEQLSLDFENEKSPSMKLFVTALEMQCTSLMMYAGFQGLKMNYKHFQNPSTPGPDFDNVDLDELVRMDIACSFPEYQQAQAVIDDFFSLLSDKQKEECQEPIRAYKASLEVNAVRLSHYYGYLMGNDLLKMFIPGYTGDNLIDFIYRMKLEDYYETGIDYAQWEGCFKLGSWHCAPIDETDIQEDFTLRNLVMEYTGREPSVPALRLVSSNTEGED